MSSLEETQITANELNFSSVISKESPDSSPKKKSLAEPSLLITRHEYVKDPRRKKSKETKGEEESTASSSSVLSEQSKEIVNNKLLNYIEDAFPNEDTLTIAQLTQIFRHLGIIGAKEKLLERSVIRETVQNWKIDDDCYDAEFARTALLEAVLRKKNTKFHKFVKIQLDVAMANKHFKVASRKKVSSPKSTSSTSTISYNLDRLLLSREELMEKPSCRKKYVPPEEPTFHTEMSGKSKVIASHSKLNTLPVYERNEVLSVKARMRIKEIEKQIKDQEKPPKIKRNSAYELTPEEREEFMARKKKKFEDSIERYPFRPNVMKWDDFEKLRTETMLNMRRPNGWDKAVDRRRQEFHRF